MSTLRVPPPGGEKPGCLDALILNVACFSAMPSGLLAVLLVARTLPEWVGQDYGIWLAFGLGVPAIVGFGLLYYHSLYALRRRIAGLRARHRGAAAPPAPNRAEMPDLGTITIRRGNSEATLRVAEAKWMLVDHPGGTEMLIYLAAPAEAGDPSPAREDGLPHPGASLRIFLPIEPDPEPPLRILARDLEDPHHDVLPRDGVPPSTLFDYEYSTVARFKLVPDIEKSRPGLIHLDCQARTAGGPGGDPPPIRFAISCLFSWEEKQALGDRSWAQLTADLICPPSR